MRRAVLFLAAVCFLFVFNAALFAKTNNAAIFSLEGEVAVKLAKAKEWLPAKVGMFLNQGDSIKTGVNSMAVVSFDPGTDKNLIKLQENCAVLLTTLKANLTAIELSAGKVLSSVENLNRRAEFKIRTPTAVAGVRGTGFSAAALPMTAEFAAFKNSILVEAFNQKGKVIDKKTVQEGFKVEVELFQKIGELTSISEEERRIWDAWKGTQGKAPAGDNTKQTIQEVNTIQGEQDEIEQGELDNIFDGSDRQGERRQNQGGSSPY
jgi:hypothetical protein